LGITAKNYCKKQNKDVTSIRVSCIRNPEGSRFGMASGLAAGSKTRQTQARPGQRAPNYTHIGPSSHVAIP
jgi:hypothetical protein